MLSTMQDFPLTINHLFEHGRRVHGASEIVTSLADGRRQASFTEVADRADRLASALRRLGVGPGDRVATFLWNTQEHVEAYLAVPCMGAVLHTLNLRLHPAQLVQIINHAEDKVILVDGTVASQLATAVDDLRTVRAVRRGGARRWRWCSPGPRRVRGAVGE